MTKPKIRVGFYLTGDYFEIEEITRILKITPTSFRTKEEWPDVIKYSENLPEGIGPETCWELDTEEETCMAVSVQFEKILKVLKGKELLINNLANKFCLEATFNVIINAELVELPELFLTNEIISFASSINAEIVFDLYIDSTSLLVK